MAHIEKTVFISYRRKDISWALNVYQDLIHHDYDVFFDYKSIPSGDFEQIIISNIKARAHFVLILTPTALDRCSKPGDWLRREIETAIDEKRNIIPLLFDSFSFGAASVSEKMTGKLRKVSQYNGMNVHKDYFPEAMERLRTKFLNVPLDAVLHPISDQVQEVVKRQQVAANQALLQSQKERPIIRQKTIIEASKPLLAVKLPEEIILSNGMKFMRVPGGKFSMGSNDLRDWKGDENPPHTVEISYEYFMGRCPVTNELYNEFTHKRFDKGKENHPVIINSWYGAQNYVKWLNDNFVSHLPNGYIFCLPSEAEWEKAARGEQGLIYPWGNQFDKNKCNSKEGGHKGTTPVAMYSPRGDSPYGCADMVGNVWEWTRSIYKPYPYVADDGREVKNPINLRMTLRGGSWLNDNGSVRASARINPPPNNLWIDIGFRVCLAPPVKQSQHGRLPYKLFAG